MPEPDLENTCQLDFSRIELHYEVFRELARNPNLSENAKMGFGDYHRFGNEEIIFADILAKLPPLKESSRSVVDIGSGCGRLARLLMAHCAAHNHRLVQVDSPEMLALLPDAPEVTRIAGPYPDNAAFVRSAAGGNADAILCYSVFGLICAAANPFPAVDHLIELLAPGGCALLGDIPNISKRKRFFASKAGADFHRQFMKTDAPPDPSFNRLEPGMIDDAVLAAVVRRAQNAGCDAYVVPQAQGLPMANRRDDVLIRKP